MVELLKHKANVNIVNKKKQTPLHIAVGVTSPECIKILLKANADPSMKVLVSNINFTDTIIHDAKILDCPNDKKYYKLIAFQKWVWKWINLVIKLCKLQLTLKYYFQKWVWWKWWSVIKFPRYQYDLLLKANLWKVIDFPIKMRLYKMIKFDKIMWITGLWWGHSNAWCNCTEKQRIRYCEVSSRESTGRLLANQQGRFQCTALGSHEKFQIVSQLKLRV